MKILIIGGGNMGLTFAKSFLSSHIVTADNMLILERSEEKAAVLVKSNVGTVYGSPGVYIQSADLIILAVKPQDTPALYQSLRPYVNDQQLVLSIMAGVTTETIAKELNLPKVVRAMPNLPAQVGSGMTVFTSTDEVTRLELVTVQNLLNATGKTIYVNKEDMIDAATAISGSGPAYVFFYMQSLMEASESMGFSKAESELLVYQTFKGAVELFSKHDFTCLEWIKMVSSKGGTTEAAFSIYDGKDVRSMILKASNAARARAIELSKS